MSLAKPQNWAGIIWLYIPIQMKKAIPRIETGTPTRFRRSKINKFEMQNRVTQVIRR